jgi:predicted enzyme related to lactoylglutathione lyase
VPSAAIAAAADAGTARDVATRGGESSRASSGGVPSRSDNRGYDRHWTPVHLDFAVDDLEAAVAQAVAAGARLELQIAERKWGRIAVLADPFGHGFCLLQFVGRGYDEIATGEG